MLSWSRQPRPTRVVIVAMATFVLFFGLSSWFRQVNLYTSQFDMGNMDQVLWHTVHGQWFQLNNPIGYGLESRTAIHTDFALLMYAPFYALWPDPRLVMILQVLAVASGTIPLFWLARARLGPNIADILAVLYLAYPTLEWAVMFDVHAVVLAIPLFLWAWWAATEKRWWWYGVTAGLAMLTKEEVGLVVAAMGLYWVWRRGYRTMGLVSMIIGLSWTIIMVGWAIPHFRHAPGHFALGYFSDYGHSYSSILSTAINQPWHTLSDIFDRRGFELLGALLFPVGLVPLFGWPVLLVALPDVAINLMSNDTNQQAIFFQYQAVTTPFIFLAAIEGWAWIKRRWPAAIRGLAMSVGVVAAASIWWLSPLPGTRHAVNALQIFHANPYRGDVRQVQALLRPDDRVATTNNLGPQFSRRPMIWAFPNDLDRADAIVVLEGGDHDPLPPAEISAAIQKLRTNTQFVLIYHRLQFWYFRRATN